jgi:putative Mg2+ transporter-C (MgtC) family protein
VTDFPLVDWWKVGANLLTVAAAYLLALPVAWEREKHARSAGLRTFPLVAVASSGYMLLAERLFPGNAEALARLVQGLMTGIGFIGGGAILKHGASVRGTATAASIWTTGAIGASVVFGRYEIAIVLSLITFFTLRVLTKFKADAAGDEAGGEGRDGGR